MLILRNEKAQPMTLIEFYWEFLTLKIGGIDPVNSIPAPWASLREGHPFYDWLQSFKFAKFKSRENLVLYSIKDLCCIKIGTFKGSQRYKSLIQIHKLSLYIYLY